MLHKKSFKAVLFCIAAIAVSPSLISLTHAADFRIDVKTHTETPAGTAPNTGEQPETAPQPQRAAPSQPSGVEPVDGDDTALA